MHRPTTTQSRVHPPDAATTAETAAMHRAIALASRALGCTSPNPVVGCVVLSADGSTVGQGFHRAAGKPHAEVEALAAAGEAARGGTAVVTLEPCAHHGKTGPCADALISAGVARVVYAVPDPNPSASGGSARLLSAGVEAVSGVLRKEAEHGNRMWLTATRNGLPFVTWKFGASIDGRVAAADGSSRWITGPLAREDAHRLRATHDAVLVGAGTLHTDDPHLGLRHGVSGCPPLRVVLDSGSRIRPDARVLDDAAPTLVAISDTAPSPPIVAETVRMRSPGGQLDLRVLLVELYQRGIRSVLVEGGPRLAASLVAAGLVDEVVAYLAPVLLGAGRSLLGQIGVDALSDAVRLDVAEIELLGGDVRAVLRPVPLQAEGA
jgi:diaminohydroxyphosphoribosylaminopyrimidine deaminase/5-amino-6-(5-phosphoribosylamino)uracil reductase